MKIKVKLVSIFFIMLFSFVLVGCNGESTSIEDTNITTVEVTTTEEPTTEEPTTEEPTTEEPTTEVPTTEEPTTEEPTTEEPTTEEPTTEEPTTEVPTTEEPTTEEPTTEEPTTEVPTTEEPTTEEPTTEVPTTEEPTTEEPTTEEPTTEEPTTEVPTTEEPTTEEPTTEEPTTEEPTTEEPTTEEPTTEEPTTEEPTEIIFSDLLISEYGEGSSFNKYIEIFNGTGAPVDLSNYTLSLYSNGSTTVSRSMTLSGTLDHYDVYVIAHPSAVQEILNKANVTNGEVINFNGDDQIALSKNGIIIDFLGRLGVRENYAIDVTMVRKIDVLSPSTTYDSNEWIVYPINTFDYLGSHHDFAPLDTIRLEQDYQRLPNSIVLYGDWNFGFGTNGSTYTVLGVTGEASNYVMFNENYIISLLDEDQEYFGQIEVEVKLDGVGVLIKYIDLMVTYSFLDLRTHPEYYQDIDPDLSGEVLLLALRALINDGFVGVSYGEARYILAESDANPNNPDEIILFYLRTIVDNNWDGGNTWNREHVWPQSYLGSGDIDNETINIASDLHNLKPTNPLENSSRGNKYFDNLTTSSTYEPHDDVKGDVARILLYMIVMYDYLELVNNPSGSEVYQMGVLETLLEWHIIDPVDDFELNRNNVIYFYQGNRNPFIDRPDYVDLIWGELEE